jgi:hypothetical protein
MHTHVHTDMCACMYMIVYFSVCARETNYLGAWQGIRTVIHIVQDRTARDRAIENNEIEIQRFLEHRERLQTGVT